MCAVTISCQYCLHYAPEAAARHQAQQLYIVLRGNNTVGGLLISGVQLWEHNVFLHTVETTNPLFQLISSVSD